MLRIFMTCYISLIILLIGMSETIAAQSEFAGNKSCVACHTEQQQNWQGSDHDLAMQHASEDTVLGDFESAEVSANGITSRFFKKDGKFWVNTDGSDGSMQDFEIRYVFGVRPLQQYLVEFPDGRIQTLRIAWDTRPQADGGQRWFQLYPDQAIQAGDLLHWTGLQQNWNYMCADCHTTNLVKGYDSRTNTFNTTWSDINVGCESCHGPGQQHLAWAALGDELKQDDASMGLAHLLRDRNNVNWIMNPDTGIAQRNPPATGSNSEIDTCAACHSRRGQLKSGIENDGSFLDHYRPALLTDDLYYTDGQILDEVYVWGSFVQSKMRAAGVTCSDCHEPHSLKLRAEQELVCAQCHMQSKYASTKHHRHQVESSGANCLDCHMPETTYMVVDPRRDHSLRIPRPDLSLEYATPNACNQCHTEKSTTWAAAEFKKLWPDVSEPYQSWTKAFSLARSGAPQAEIALIKIIRDQSIPAIARATAVSELQPFLSPLSGQVVQVALADNSPLVRFAALRVLDALPAENRYQLSSPLLEDPVLLVRTEAARISAPALSTQLSATERRVLQSALEEYTASQMHNAERPESHLNLGNLYTQTGNVIESENALRRAIELDQKFSPAYANLADLYRAQGMDQAAGDVLNEGIENSAEDGTLYHSRGLMQARGQRMDLALNSLKKAAELQPEIARYAYVYGVALNSAGNTDAALQVLKQNSEVHPGDLETIFMIASIYRDMGKNEEALVWAQRLLTINPADQNATQFIKTLKTPKQ
jgi:tetratricopeptide (TPR) repeat protein